MKRRAFLKNTLTSSTLLSFGTLPFSIEDDKMKHITILHTNDVHSYIDAFPPDHPKNPNLGGVSKRASLIESIRKENPNTLLLDAGDIFQGTPYFNYYGGELEIKLMSMMKYDVGTLGNHDFDNGLEGFYKQLPHANFEFVSANYDFKNTILDTHIKPYTIKKINGLKIGIFGLGVELDGLVDKKNYKETKYYNPIEIANDVTKKLKKEEHCDLIICLSHLGFQYKNDPEKVSDIKLAKNTKDIDLIIGGHSHTFMEKPVIELNSVGKQVLINQVGCYGINLGRIDFYFTKNKELISKGTSIKV